MSVIDVEIRRRNARIKAWASMGVSLEGRWVREGNIVVVHLACTHCREGQSLRFQGAPPGMAPFEKQMISKIVDVGCTHLSPLLGNDPAELAVRTTLELYRSNS
jgi:hypothetical protein